MLSQQQQLKQYKKLRKFEDMALYQPEEELISIKAAFVWAIIIHSILTIAIIVSPVILALFGIDINLINKLKLKPRNIEFVLVSQPEEEPINKNTPFRADRNTRAGGINDPNRPITPPQPALPQSAPSQDNNKKPKKSESAPAQKTVSKPQKVVEQLKQAVKQDKPKVEDKTPKAPPKPKAKTYMPVAKAPTAMKLPVPPAKGGTRLAPAPTGPVSSKPTGSYSGKPVGIPKPITATNPYGTGAGISKSTSGSGKGSSYAPHGGNVGNPGPGNPKGRPGVDAIKEPNFGPYMAELQRRIKANWDPPRGDESKRVVLLFTIAKDGRLQSIKVVKSSGSAAADRAAQAAVELTAPFRPLPSDYSGSNIDIQFTFDYNVFGVNRY